MSGYQHHEFLPTQLGWSDNTLTDLNYPTGFNYGELLLSMARTPRFGGRGALMVTVLDHSLHAAAIGPAYAAHHLALHDAHEGIIGDIISPVGQYLDQRAPGVLKALKADLDRMIYDELVALDYQMPSVIRSWIKTVDMECLRIEQLYTGCTPGMSMVGGPDALTEDEYDRLNNIVERPAAEKIKLFKEIVREGRVAEFGE